MTRGCGLSVQPSHCEGTVTRLYQETVERYEADALNILCSYFDCQIGDLLEYVPDEG